MAARRRTGARRHRRRGDGAIPDGPRQPLRQRVALHRPAGLHERLLRGQRLLRVAVRRAVRGLRARPDQPSRRRVSPHPDGPGSRRGLPRRAATPADGPAPATATAACAMGAAGLACGSSTCSGNIVTPPPRCNGAGGCEPQPAQVCARQLSLRRRQRLQGDLRRRRRLRGRQHLRHPTGRCSAPKALGAACDPGDDGRDCASGHCVDGVCCDTACDGDCLGLRERPHRRRSGTCAPVAAGKDPRRRVRGRRPRELRRRRHLRRRRGVPQVPRRHGLRHRLLRGQGGGKRLCEYACRLGNCDTNTSIERAQCGGLTNCCCTATGRQASCALLLSPALRCDD